MNVPAMHASVIELQMLTIRTLCITSHRTTPRRNNHTKKAIDGRRYHLPLYDSMFSNVDQ